MFIYSKYTILVAEWQYHQKPRHNQVFFYDIYRSFLSVDESVTYVSPDTLGGGQLQLWTPSKGEGTDVSSYLKRNIENER